MRAHHRMETLVKESRQRIGQIMKLKFLAAVAAATALTLGACSDSDPKEDPTTTAGQPTQTATTDAPAGISTDLAKSKDALPPILAGKATSGDVVDVGDSSLRISTDAAKAFADPQKNIWFSAASLQVALAMLADGADADMASKLATFYATSGTTPGTAALSPTLAKVQGEYIPDQDMPLGGTRFGGAYFVNPDAPGANLDLDKISSFAGGLGAYVKQGGADALNEAGSAWASLVSGGLIPKLPLTIPDTAALTLAGSSYAAGTWSGDAPKPEPIDFTSAAGTKSTVDGLSFGSYDVFIYKAPKGYIAIPKSTGPEFQLYLTDQGVDPSSLTSADWEYDENAQLNGTATFPKLKLTETYDLIEVGDKLGMPDITSAGYAGFSKDNTALSVAAVVQASALDVNEKGFAAASITVVQLDGAGPMPTNDPVDLVFDRPFALRIQTPNPDWTLFYGVINDAAAAQE